MQGNTTFNIRAGVSEAEYTGTEVRDILHALYPFRKLVLSQFTFFNQTGVCKPSGSFSMKGRVRYRLRDLLSIMVILELKEQGISLKRIQDVPDLIRSVEEQVMAGISYCRICGCGGVNRVCYSPKQAEAFISESILSSSFSRAMFWSLDLVPLAVRIKEAERNVLGKFDRVAERMAKYKRFAKVA